MAQVLVVEDNPINLKLVRLILETAGHAVLPAPDAETALATVGSIRPDLILMDIQLPGMSGFEALALLKRQPHSASIPVLAVTAMAMKGDAERIAAAGFDGYVTKPLRSADLLAAIAPHLTGAVPDYPARAGNRTS